MATLTDSDPVRVDHVEAGSRGAADAERSSDEAPGEHEQKRSDLSVADAGAGDVSLVGGIDSFAVIDFDPATGSRSEAFRHALRLEFAQATTDASASDSGPSIRVLDIPPYQLAGGALALGLVAGGAGGGGSSVPSAESFIWGASNLSINTVGGSVVTVDASSGGDGRVLTLVGASDVNVNGYKGSNSIDAAALTGNLTINILDDGVLSRLALSTGSARTTVNAGDARDILTIDAAKAGSSGSLVITGRSSTVQVNALATSLDASSMLSGDLNVVTSAGAAAPRTISIRSGAGASNVTAQTGDTIMLDAEALLDNATLKTAGAAKYQINNLMGDLDNSASGGVSVALDHDPVPGVQLSTTIRSSTAITVANGALDANDTIVLDGAGAFTVTGLVASLDTRAVTSVPSVTTADSLVNRIAITAGPSGMAVNGTAVSDTIAIDASRVADGVALQLRGGSGFAVSDLPGDINASQALGSVTVATPVAGDQSIALVFGAAGGQVRASSNLDAIAVDALAIAKTGRLTIGGSSFDGQSVGAVTVTGLSASLDNQGTGVVAATLAKAAGTEPTVVSLTSANAISIANGTLGASDTIQLSGPGSFKLSGIVTNVDGTAITDNRAVELTLASSADSLSINLGPGTNGTVVLDGASTVASLRDVETLNVGKGGNIAGASITDAATAPTSGRITGTAIDFADQTATLVISPAQHEDVRTLLLTGRADEGAQTLQLSAGAKISQTIPYVDVYRLSELGSDTSVTINGQAVAVRNDVQQQIGFGSGQTSAPLTVMGSGGSDAVKTAAVDVMRGSLNVDLASDLAGAQSDYLFVNNSVIGNQVFSSLNETGGLGGRVSVYSTNPTVYSNAATLSGTIDQWRSLTSNLTTIPSDMSAGVRAANVSGFDTAADKIVYLEASSDVALAGFLSVTQTNPPGFAPPANSVIEIESGFIQALALTKPGVASVGTDPRALDKIATLLAELPGFNDDNGDPYYVVVYDYTPQAAGVKADAWLYAAIATQDDGFDFADNQPLNAERDTDTLELIAIFKGVGVNAFTSSNFI